MSASTCKPPRPALISTGPPSGPPASAGRKASAFSDAPRLRRQRQQDDEHVGPRQQPLEPLARRGRSRRPRATLASRSSADDPEAERLKLRRRVAAEHAEPSTPTETSPPSAAPRRPPRPARAAGARSGELAQVDRAHA